MFKNNEIILFQGDSITDMNRGRNSDPNHLYGHSYVFLLASRLGYEYPEKNLTIYNRGISANRTIDLYSRWKEDALNLKPDVISILIGINDIALEKRNNSGLDSAQYKKVYSLIIEETQEKLQNVQMVLCEPFSFPMVLPEDDRNYMENEIKKRQEIVRILAEKYKCIFVPLQNEFDKAYYNHPELGYKYWMWDGIHPTAAGHQIIALKWLKCVNNG